MPERARAYIQKMFSSHPETQKRIDHMKKRCEQDGILPGEIRLNIQTDFIYVNDFIDDGIDGQSCGGMYLKFSGYVASMRDDSVDRQE